MCLLYVFFCLFQCVLDAGVKSVRWPSSPSQTCRYTPKLTQRQRLTSVLTALSHLRTHRTWPSTCAYTWELNLTAAPTVRNVFASSPICSSTPGLISTHTLCCRHCTFIHQSFGDHKYILLCNINCFSNILNTLMYCFLMNIQIVSCGDIWLQSKW